MRKKEEGVTLIEIVVAVGIVALLGALSLVSFISSRNSRELVTSGQNVLSILRLAQSKTLAAEDNSQWGVHLEQSRVILFRGATFSGATSTETHLLPSNIEIVNISLSGGGTDVVFNKLNGGTVQAGTFELRVRSSLIDTFPVTVGASGNIYQTGSALTPLGSRLVDARHRAFTLGWSIRNSLSLALTFSDPPNPDTVVSVVMTPSAPRTTFDWSGTITIGGQEQVIRIHAASITDGNTVLQVDRDCRRNTKKVKVAIDTRDIATYGSDCKTVTVGPFGGTMTEP